MIGVNHHFFLTFKKSQNSLTIDNLLKAFLLQQWAEHQTIR